MSYELIKQAIANKKCIRAIYKNLPREMCPHVIGINKKGGQQALFYQYGGESNSRPIMPDGSGDNWRCLEVSKLSFVEIIDGRWHTAPNHSEMQTCVAFVDLEVAY